MQPNKACIDTGDQKQRQFLALAERFRKEEDPDVANRLGLELGHMIFGPDPAETPHQISPPAP